MTDIRSNILHGAGRISVTQKVENCNKAACW